MIQSGAINHGPKRLSRFSMTSLDATNETSPQSSVNSLKSIPEHSFDITHHQDYDLEFVNFKLNRIVVDSIYLPDVDKIFIFFLRMVELWDPDTFTCIKRIQPPNGKGAFEVMLTNYHKIIHIPKRKLIIIHDMVWVYFYTYSPELKYLNKIRHPKWLQSNRSSIIYKISSIQSTEHYRGELLFVAGSTSYVQIWNIRTMKIAKKVETCLPFDSNIVSMKLLPDHGILAIGPEPQNFEKEVQGILLYNVTTWAFVKTIGFDGFPHSMYYNPFTKNLIVYTYVEYANESCVSVILLDGLDAVGLYNYTLGTDGQNSIIFPKENLLLGKNKDQSLLLLFNLSNETAQPRRIRSNTHNNEDTEIFKVFMVKDDKRDRILVFDFTVYRISVYEIRRN